MEHSSKNRRYPRVGLKRGIYIAWQGIGERVVSQIKTVGLGGLFIKVKEPPQVGDVIKLYFEVPGGQVRARAVIRTSVRGDGMGIQFTSMGTEARGKLTQLLRSLLRETDPTQAPQPVDQ
jgi:hypothetical protein